MNHTPPTALTVGLAARDVQVEISGRVPRRAVEEARVRVAALARYTHRPILFARVALNYAADPAVARPASARAVIDVNGHAIHAHASGASMHQAIAEMQRRLRVQLEKEKPDHH